MSPPNIAPTPYPASQEQQTVRILVVEDDEISMAFLEAQVSGLGYEMVTARDGAQAVAYLAEHGSRIDAVLMDREMPVMDGLTAVHRIKEMPALQHIPIVMVTGADSSDELQQGIDAGVFYYLAKPVDEQVLRSVLSATLREVNLRRVLVEEQSKHRTSFDLIETCRFRFKTLDEAESLAAFIANCFPDPARVLSGLGELMINAVEHGNCRLGYEAKAALIEAGRWRAEIDRRQSLPEYRQKTATATIARKPEGVYAIITDEGEGFDWQTYLALNLSKASGSHGRSIAKAKASSFDRLTYNTSGNQLVAFVSTREAEGS